MSLIGLQDRVSGKTAGSALTRFYDEIWVLPGLFHFDHDVLAVKALCPGELPVLGEFRCAQS